MTRLNGQMEIHIEIPTFSAPVIFQEQAPLSSGQDTKPQWWGAS